MLVETRKTGRDKGRSVILTSTPEKAKIEEKSRKLSKSDFRRRILFPEPRVSQGEEAGTSGVNAQKNDSSDDESNGGGQSEGAEVLMQSGNEAIDKEVAIGDFIIVRVPSQRGEGRNYVAKVTSIEDNGFWVIYMVSKRRSGFFYPGNEAPKFALGEDLVKILPQPQPAGGTTRAQACVKFPFSPL